MALNKAIQHIVYKIMQARWGYPDFANPWKGAPKYFADARAREPRFYHPLVMFYEQSLIY